jgi:hypothetical protein
MSRENLDGNQNSKCTGKFRVLGFTAKQGFSSKTQFRSKWEIDIG